jgi:hypothetical protein
VYGKEDWEADTAVWLGAARDKRLSHLRLHSGQAWLEGVSPAREMMTALRQVGLLDEVIETKEGLVEWPARLGAEDSVG